MKEEIHDLTGKCNVFTYMRDDIEKKCDQLAKEKATFKTKIHNLEMENKTLKWFTEKSKIPFICVIYNLKASSKDVNPTTKEIDIPKEPEDQQDVRYLMLEKKSEKRGELLNQFLFILVF